ncbi:MAG: primosomal protein N' [SAR202 cluster bacterium Io17-Chloro-G6]|nr:MAG: primosomal protein N' [SAR202 cluster bacterium Io17-Chloro-G6]
MRYAEVAVDAVVGHSRTFSYSILPRFTVEPGQLVWVPFGARVLQGLVVELVDVPNVPQTRDILQPVEPSPLIDPLHLQLGRWISAHYRCSMFTALAPLLPPGFEAHVRSRITAVPGADPAAANLRPESVEALEVLSAKKTGLDEADFTKLLGRNGGRELGRLVDRGLVRRRLTMPRPRVAPKYEGFLLPSPATGDQEETSLPPRQEGLLAAVREQRTPYPAALANREFGNGVGQALFGKGLVAMEWVRTDAASTANPEPATGREQHNLTTHQSEALSRIQAALDDPQLEPRSFLLHGVTGSGKTEVYLRAIDQVVRQGRQGIFLVPEISLTPQTLERVNAWFPGRVAVMHSRLTARQQFDQWWDIREGKYDVVVGPRSSLFAPLADLGLIVIDEEHEWTYKQIETHPLYHARAAALELGRISGSPVLMGSATPGVETYHAATRGRHRLLELPDRVSAGPDRVSRLAEVQVCDMRRELREGNRSIFSRALAQGLEVCITEGHQAILFLNRRGASSIVQCRDCGHVVTCRSCSVSLTYHLNQTRPTPSRSSHSRLLCHRCNRAARMPSTCPTCGGTHIRQLGVGTQRVVEEVKKLLPQTTVDRLDADATRSGQDMEDIMARLSSGDTQVLVGTQMVAKGLDIPNVTLVGVVLADIGLYLPDFRSGERAFGLLCQVAGRAGRGEATGQVIVQTYNPDHYAIQAAAAQDYHALYRHEIDARREMGSPPFNQLVHLVFQDRNENQAVRQATETAKSLSQRAQAQGLTDIDVVGPAPGVPSRIRGRHRWHLTLKGRGLLRFMEGLEFPPGCTVDVDPVHVL